jgi:PHO85 cyclin-5
VKVGQETNLRSLLGFTDRLLVALWPPLATISQGDIISTNRSLVPLCAYIEYILRRSRATYATLLATLYYLALLRSTISRQKSTTDQPEDLERVKPLQCQRRMFLAALILAWKCTQDRNYSLGVWAKISGLCSKEIKSNEAVFLSTVDWRLHIPHAVFERWATEVVYYARLPDLALPDSLLSCLKEDPDWPYRSSLLESSRDHFNIREHSVAKLALLCLVESSDTHSYVAPYL